MKKVEKNRLENETKKDRRTFLKKAIYSAPTIVALGYLSNPTNAFAEYNSEGVPCGGPGQPSCDT